MSFNNLQECHTLLFHSLFTCIYMIGIIMYLYFSNNLYSVGSYKFIFILFIIITAELLKLSFLSFQTTFTLFEKLDSLHLNKSKRNLIQTIRDSIKFLIASAGITFIYYFLIVMFGAPFFSHYEETAMLSLTLTTLTLVPASLYLGLENTLILFKDIQLPTSGAVLEAIKINIKFVIVGTWLSACVLPLDWDRPWQDWPIPCIVGALLGHFTAHFVTLVKMLIIKFNNKRRKYHGFKTC